MTRMGRSLPYEIFIGLRYLKARRQRSLSVIALISIAGVAVGVLALIVVMAVMSGFEFDLRNKILGTNAHIWLLRYGERGIEDPAPVLASVREVPGVTAASPFTYSEVLLTAAGRTATSSAPRRTCRGSSTCSAATGSCGRSPAARALRTT